GAAHRAERRQCERPRRLARARTRAHFDPRSALGSLTLSHPRRGELPEGPSPARLPPVFRFPPAEGVMKPIGRVVATELKPATPHQFHFWTATNTTIGIGAIVRVGTEERTVYGVVTDGFAYSDLPTPLHDVLGAEGDPARAAESPTVRQEIRLWLAAVLRQEPEEPLQPVPIGDVFVADDADVARALRMESYLTSATPTAIP